MQCAVSEKLDTILEAVGQIIVGQRDPLEKMLIAMLCNGHVLLEGVPGIAKTMMVNTLAQALNADFSRIQFTPDLLPGDLVGTQVYRHETGAFEVHRGPIFANVVLADEINRSPAKVQSALLEGMQERQVTLGGETHKLPEPFMVLATQNPIEQEGTYSLPEAQIDRFMFKLLIEYPTHDEEHEIMRRVARTNPVTTVRPVATLDDVLAMRETLDGISMTMSNTVAFVFSLIKRVVEETVASIKDKWEKSWEFLTGIMGRIWSSIAMAWESIKESINERVEKIKSDLKDAWNQIRNTITEKATAIFDIPQFLACSEVHARANALTS